MIESDKRSKNIQTYDTSSNNEALYILTMCRRGRAVIDRNNIDATISSFFSVDQ
jgi:hypothetical protein